MQAESDIANTWKIQAQQSIILFVQQV